MKTSPVSSACSRTTAAKWCRNCGRRSMRPTMAPTSRSSSPISTRSIPGMPALREAKVPNTLRGPVRFDELGNVVGNIYLRKVEKKDGRYVNAVIKTYPDVSQFWTYKQDEFLKNPVYSRDYPPAKNLEQ